MDTFSKYYNELVVKASLLQSKEDLKQDILEFSTEIYNLQYLKIMRDLFLHDKTLFIHDGIKEHLQELMDVIQENYQYIYPDKPKFMKIMSEIKLALSIAPVYKEEDFYALEYKKRTGRDINNFSDAEKEIVMCYLNEAIYYDTLFINCLNPDEDMTFNLYASDECEPLIEQYFMWSIRKFYDEKNELFANPIAYNRVIENMEMIAYPSIKLLNGKNKAYYSEMSNNSIDLLNKIR